MTTRDGALRELSAADAAGRARSARALARWDDADVVRGLVDALGDADAGVRDAAADSLLMIGGAGTVPVLLPLLRSDDAATRNRAAHLLERLGRVVPEALLELSRDADPRMRLFSANILAGTGDHGFAPRLMELLGDPDVNVRDSAVVGLGRMRVPAAVPALVARLRDADPWSFFSAVDALGNIATPDACRGLLEAVPAADPEARVACVEALGATRRTEAAAGLVDLAARFPELGPAAARALLGPLAHALGEVPGAPAALAAELSRGTADDILRSLASPTAAVRLAGVEAARIRRLAAAVPWLERLRSDPDAGVRAAALGKERP